MTDSVLTVHGGPVFDGLKLHDALAVRLEDGFVAAVGPEGEVGLEGREIDLSGDILAPGYVDLQVNGGGGVMFNDDPSAETLARIASAHRGLGTAAILPTLITDTPDRTRAAVAAVENALAAHQPGIAGLHLEGPHLSLARKGAHDPALIRPMTDDDLRFLLDASRRIPVLMVTIAPENVTLDQAAAMTMSGIVLSLGHTDTDYNTCLAYQRAGVRCVTHLFNAMSQLGNREPGVVGAAIDTPDLSAGLIADGVHVHPTAMRAALSAKRGPGAIFLVTDAMAPAGSGIGSFELNGRTISRAGGRLTLSDGTLAGADLEMTRAVQVLVQDVGIALDVALRAATSIPADLAGIPAGRIIIGATDLIRIDKGLGGCTPVAA